MKILILCVLLAFFGCEDSATNSAMSVKENRFITLERATMALLDNQDPQIDDEALLEDAKALISRATQGRYKLVSADSIKDRDAIIIQTSDMNPPLPNAEIFTFARALSINEDGSEWNWNEDSMGKNIDDFKRILGEDSSRLIIFYDSGEDIFSPAGSAHTALLWARHLGYNNIARIIGGYGALKESAL